MRTAFILIAAFVTPTGVSTRPADVPPLKVRDGYRLTAAAGDLPGAWFLEFSDAGRLFVARPFADPVSGRPRDPAGDIVVLWDPDPDGVFRRRETFLCGRERLHGLAWHKGWLYYTYPDEIRRARDTDGDGKADEDQRVVGPESFPLDSHRGNWWRSLLVTDDGLLTAIGDSGNITDEPASERQRVWAFDPNGSNKRPFASGLRSTAKLRLRPGTREVYGIDLPTDGFGRTLGEDPASPAKGQPITDENPPGELNLLTEGGFYGHPFLAGNRVPRPEYAARKDLVEIAARTTIPAWSFPAHWRGYGFTFVDPEINRRGRGLPQDHAGDLIAAFHGSWNRSTPTGACLARVLFDPQTGKPFGMLTLVDAMPDGRRPLARPVDCAQAPDGSIVFSCDLTGRIYRLRSSEPVR